jgi:23S rRNA pseudouridine1911/1915/1917 synthase
MSLSFTSPLIVPPGGKTDRIDLYLIQRGATLSRSRIQRLIEAGEIRVNGKKIRPSYRVRPGDKIDITLTPPAPLEVAPEEIPLDVVYEDDALLVVNKPAGMVVHPAPGNPNRTLVNALLYHCRGLPGIGGRERPGIVHRLDKETSGLLVVAKTDRAHQQLSRQFKEHTIQRRYLALVYGNVSNEQGKIDLAIGRDVWERKKISPRSTRPRSALTRYKVVERFGSCTLLAVCPQTGRTHQIRVHMAHLKHPVVGDKVYAGHRRRDITGIEVRRQMLHAETLGFLHPVRSEPVQFIAPIPDDMNLVLLRLRDAVIECSSQRSISSKERSKKNPRPTF